MSSLSASMSGLSVSGNSKPPPKTPPRSQGQRQHRIPNAPGRKRKAMKLDSSSEERIYMANKKYRDGMGALTGKAPEMGGSRRRRRRSKRRKSRRKRKTKRKKKRKSRKTRKTRRRRRKKRKR